MKVVSGGGRRFGIADKVFVESFLQVHSIFNAGIGVSLNFMRSSFLYKLNNKKSGGDSSKVGSREKNTVSYSRTIHTISLGIE